MTIASLKSAVLDLLTDVGIAIAATWKEMAIPESNRLSRTLLHLTES
jgi:hypothetical protein